MISAKKISSSKKVVSKGSSKKASPKKASPKKASPKKAFSESVDPYTDYDPYASEIYGNSENLSKNLKDLDTTGLTTNQKVIIAGILTGGTVGAGAYAYNKLTKKPVVVKPKPVVKPGFFTRLAAQAKPKPVVKPGLFSGMFGPKPVPKKTFKSIFKKQPVPKKFLGIF